MKQKACSRDPIPPLSIPEQHFTTDPHDLALSPPVQCSDFAAGTNGLCNNPCSSTVCRCILA
ncbi:hypothetical protein I7I53_11057 [Histoplasma capsulatum var. duboisii H88]|uniref:Uncharacterized protein n=1 Tax=Ajellomyces capsulatus (strain H88) TaxID=544711 RepID=A0A8A1LC23_AJEC8|nr:hypothetical protein I7I53_11057 [Histoplasma capsulatum var. duboisii H88]